MTHAGKQPIAVTNVSLNRSEHSADLCIDPSPSPAWFDHLFCDIVEEVPPAEGKGGLEEGQRNPPHCRALEKREGHVWSQSIIVACAKAGHEKHTAVHSGGASKCIYLQTV